MDAARQDVKYDEVSAVATSLHDDGETVTVEAVQDSLGFGSAIAIHKHLVTWRSMQEKPAEKGPAMLPEPLASALAEWANQYAQDASAGVRASLAQAHADLETLLRAGEELEAQRDGLRDEAASVSSARDEALELLAQRNEEIERLTAELRDARKVATEALVNKAKDQLAIDGKDAQLADLRAQIERSVAAQASESDARLAAQMELVGVTTERDNLAAEIKQLRAQLDAINAERGVFRARTS